ncbi:hypothetical protein IKF81_03455 [Candidatus Saccharibacteria bacterium]|nr:hypothetical protein [Candidatus Saccharibacteria bacterium]
MKPSDYFSVFGLAIVGTIIGYFLTNSLLGDPADKSVSFEYIETVSADLVEPDAELFNSGAINPTVEVYVGSCEDRDQDGYINQAELIECGQASPESKSSSESSETNNSDSSQSSVLQGGSDTSRETGSSTSGTGSSTNGASSSTSGNSSSTSGTNGSTAETSASSQSSATTNQNANNSQE